MGASKVPVGFGRDGQPVFVNFEFVDGTRGAHVSISGVFSVKGEDLLFLDYANSRLTAAQPALHARLAEASAAPADAPASTGPSADQAVLPGW
jgi:uncharacterized protein